MTTTLSPNDAGDIGAAAKPPVPFIEGLPILAPVGLAKLAELSAGETMVLEVGVTPAEQPTALVPRPAEPTVYRPELEPVRLPRYRGEHRKADPWWAVAAIGAGSVLLVEAVVALVVRAVTS